MTPRNHNKKQFGQRSVLTEGMKPLAKRIAHLHQSNPLKQNTSSIFYMGNKPRSILSKRVQRTAAKNYHRVQYKCEKLECHVVSMHYNTIQQMNTCIGAQTETKQYTQQTYTESIVPTNLHSGKRIA